MSEINTSIFRDPETLDILEYNPEKGFRNPKTGEEYPETEEIIRFIKNCELTGHNKRYAGLYDRMAFLYDFTSNLYADIRGGGLRKRREEFLLEIEIKTGDLVLETSIGTGLNVKLLEKDAFFYGIDISEGMLKKCRKNMKRWKRKAFLSLANAESLPFADNIFDSIYHLGGINFFNDIPKALSEMFRVAKPGTKIVVCDETADIAEKFKKIPVSRGFYNLPIHKLEDYLKLVPEKAFEKSIRPISDGELYVMTFRKPLEI